MGIGEIAQWVSINAVIANPDYQLEYIWNQLKPKQLITTVRDFLDWIIWSGMIHLKNEPRFLVGILHKSTRKKVAFAFCLLALTLLDKFIYPVPRYFFSYIRIYFFMIPVCTKEQQRHPVSWTKQLINWPLLLR